MERNKVWKNICNHYKQSYEIWNNSSWEYTHPEFLTDSYILWKTPKYHTTTIVQMQQNTSSTEVHKDSERQVNQPFLADTNIKLWSAKPTCSLFQTYTQLLDLLNTIHLINCCSSLTFILSISFYYFASKYCPKISGNGQLFGICSALIQLLPNVYFQSMGGTLRVILNQDTF